MKDAVVVEQAEEQRADHASGLVPAEAGHRAVGGPLVLDLGHDAFAFPVGGVGSLGHHAVEPGPLEAREPVGGHGGVGGRRRHVDGRGAVAEGLFEQATADREGLAPQVPSVQGEEVEGHERRRGAVRQHRHPGGGGVDALQQGVEVEPVLAGDHDLPVDDGPRREGAADGLDQLGEVPGQWPLVPAAQLDLVAVSEDHTPEAVPLRLVQHARRGRELPGQLGEHGGDRRHDGEVHSPHAATEPSTGAEGWQRQTDQRRPGCEVRSWWAEAIP